MHFLWFSDPAGAYVLKGGKKRRRIRHDDTWMGGKPGRDDYMRSAREYGPGACAQRQCDGSLT